MRKEAIKILKKLEDGVAIKQIKSNAKTRSRMRVLHYYNQILTMIIQEIQLGRYSMNVYKAQSFYEMLAEAKRKRFEEVDT